MKIRVPINVFNISVFFYFGDVERAKFIKDTGIKGFDEDSEGFTINNATWIRNDNDMETIIHESHHLKKHIVTSRGIHDEETEAYLITHIISEVVRKLRSLQK